MKTKFIYITFVIILTSVINNASSYNIPENYLINPIETSDGIIVTNEYQSAVYLIRDNQLELLFSSPGCGKYISVSHDGSKIGFKLIDNTNGLQTPTYYDLNTKTITKLSHPVKKCGQVSFDKYGAAYYTLGTKLIKKDISGTKQFELGVYSNRTPVSPDGKYAIVSDNNEQLRQYDLTSGRSIKLTDDRNGYYNTSWSSDGRYIAFQSVNAKVFILELETGKVYKAGEGENPRWSKKSDEIIYFRKEIDFNKHELTASELYSYSVNDNKVKQVTETPGIFEMNPSFNKEGKIIYDTYSDKHIKSLNPKEELTSAESVFKLTNALDINLNSNSISSIKPVETTQDLDDWIHIHQVFDTRDSGPWTNHPQNGRHQGYLCCGATACMEALASYRILPPKPFYTHGHTSQYGLYISDEYEYDGYTYSGFTTTGDRPGFMTGAHGYMWNSGGSPSSNATQFLRNHGVDAHRYDNPSWSAVKAEIDAGYPYVLCTTSLTDGHIVLGIGQYGDNQTLYCNDPYGDKNAGSYGGIYNGKNAVYDWGDENTGHITITPVVWGITARYDRTLPLVSSYPADGETNISPSAQIMLDFSNPLSEESLNNYVMLYDDNFNLVDADFDYSAINEGIIFINPVNGFEENTTYKIFIDYRTSSTNGLQFEKNSVVEFTTGSNRPVTGNVFESFENNSQFSLSTATTVDSATFIGVSNEKVYDSESSLKINYEFNNPTGSGFVRVLYDPELPVGVVTGKYLGLWVYGDCSRNQLEVWFSKEDGNIASPLKVQLNWTGWKYVSAPLESSFGTDNIKLNSIAIRQQRNNGISGKVYVDGLTIHDELPEVIDFYPDESATAGLEEGFGIRFSKPMDKSKTETALHIAPAVDGTYSWDNDESLAFIPASPLAPNTNYKVSIGIEAADIDGNNIKDACEFNFRTERTGLLLQRSYPADGMTGVNPDVKVVLDFDEYIDRNTLFGNVLFLDAENNPVDIKVDASGYSEGKVMFEPAVLLQLNKKYKVQIKTGVSDTSGIQVPEDFELTFTTTSQQYLSGNISDDFESVDKWIQPVESDYSIGVHSYSTKLAKYGTRKISGDYSAKLTYKFTGIRGICNMSLTNPVNIDQVGNVGIWVNSDYSFNDIQFVFVNSNAELITSSPFKLDWTGWKLLQVELSELPDEITTLHSLNIVQTDSGKVFSELLFDDLQTDIVLPVQEGEELPTAFTVKQNYPNPFNPATTIEYSIPALAVDGKFSSTTNVNLIVYDILGREVATLVNTKQKPGRYKVNFNASMLASGVYFYRINYAGKSISRKMMLLK